LRLRKCRRERPGEYVRDFFRNYLHDEELDKYVYPSVTDMVQELGWMTLETRRQISRLVNFHSRERAERDGRQFQGSLARGVYI
jgi:hypothetical protein